MTIYHSDHTNLERPTERHAQHYDQHRGCHQVRQCTDELCRLRFPARTDELPDQRCPRCGTLTKICAEIELSRERLVTFNSTVVDRQSEHMIAVLIDNVRSLFNVGSIFRSADGAGIHHLHLCGITPTPTNLKLAKTALGAEQVVSWTQHNNSLDCAQHLRAAGYILWALEEQADAMSIFTTPLPHAPLALVIGNEVTGVDPVLLRYCDKTATIPMQGAKRSLNVATAFGVAAVLLTHRFTTEQASTPHARQPIIQHI